MLLICFNVFLFGFGKVVFMGVFLKFLKQNFWNFFCKKLAKISWLYTIKNDIYQKIFPILLSEKWQTLSEKENTSNGGVTHLDHIYMLVYNKGVKYTRSMASYLRLTLLSLL